MMSKTSNWLRPPQLSDDDRTRRARILYAILLVAFASVSVFSLLVLFTVPNPASSLVVVFIIFAITLIAFVLMQLGKEWLAGFIFITFLWLIMTPVHFLFGGIHNTGIMIQVVIVVIAGLLLGKRATLFFTGLAILVITAVVFAEIMGYLPDPLAVPTPILLWLNFVVALLAIAALLYVAISGLYDALEQTRHNEQMLAKQNKELAQIQKTLQQNINKLEQTQSLMQEYAEELERSNRELQDFAYVASHDLQAPLRKVQAFGDRLVANYSDVLDEKGLDYVMRMQVASSRMRTLIEDLLLFSRVTTQASPFVMVDLNNVLANVVLDLDTKIEEVNGRVSIEPLPTVEADSTQMRQLFQNLISNALKFHRDAEPPEIIIATENMMDNMVTISVADNGVGFEAQYAERIFKVFERLYGRDEYEGTGIGLAICRRIVERHDGRITVESEPGQGTTFFITLPLKQTEKPALIKKN